MALKNDGSRVLSKVGRIPRLVSFGLVVLAAGVAIAGGKANPNPLAQIAVMIVPICALVLSFRIGIRIEERVLVVRSYLRTYRFDKLLKYEFHCVPYSGFWNRFVPGNRWLNFNAFMLEVSPQYGGEIPLPASLGGRRAVEELSEYLNQALKRWTSGV